MSDALLLIDQLFLMRLDGTTVHCQACVLDWCCKLYDNIFCPAQMLRGTMMSGIRQPLRLPNQQPRAPLLGSQLPAPPGPRGQVAERLRRRRRHRQTTGANGSRQGQHKTCKSAHRHGAR